MNPRIPVVLLPSLGRNASDFDQLAQSLRSASWPVIAYDPMRLVARNFASPTMDDLVEDLHQFLGSGSEPIHLVGHSFGNRVARAFAVQHPERVSSLTLLAAGGLVPMKPWVKLALRRAFDDTLPPLEHLAAIDHAFFAAESDPTVWLEGWSKELANIQRRVTQVTPAATWWFATAPRVLVMQGLQDRIAVPENGRRYVEELLDSGIDARLVELRQAGQAMLPEQPRQIAQALLSFLDSPTKIPSESFELAVAGRIRV
jgi:pimeloyl-ACP methyl ester carboxylesterase